MDGKTKKALKKIAREMQRDLRAMEQIEWLASRLNDRDSNCGSAASLTDAIEVLAKESIRLYRQEIASWEKNSPMEVEAK